MEPGCSMGTLGSDPSVGDPRRLGGQEKGCAWSFRPQLLEKVWWGRWEGTQVEASMSGRMTD